MDDEAFAANLKAFDEEMPWVGGPLEWDDAPPPTPEERTRWLAILDAILIAAEGNRERCECLSLRRSVVESGSSDVARSLRRLQEELMSGITEIVA